MLSFRKMSTAFAAVFAAILMFVTPVSTIVKTNASYYGVKVTDAFDITNDGIVNIYDLIVMKRSIINETSAWRVTDVVRLQKFLLASLKTSSIQAYNVSKMEVSPENIRRFENFFASDFSKSYIEGLDGSITMYFDDYYQLYFDSEIVKFDDKSLQDAEVIASFPCPDKHQTLYVGIIHEQFILFVESDTPEVVNYLYMADIIPDTVSIRLIRNLSNSDLPKHVETTAGGSVQVTFAKSFILVFDATKNCVVNEIPENASEVTRIAIADEGIVTIITTSEDGNDGDEKFQVHLESLKTVNN